MTDISCKSIQKKDLEYMLELINMQEDTNKEQGTLLCQKNDKIVTSGHCIGSKCEIIPKKFERLSCTKGTKEIGIFHTHADMIVSLLTHTEHTIPSASDIKVSVTKNHKLFCIGTGEKYPTGKYNRRIKCYNIKNEELKKLGNEYLKASEIKRKEILKSINRVILSGKDIKDIVNDLLNEKCIFEDIRWIKDIPPSRKLKEEGKTIELI